MRRIVIAVCMLLLLSGCAALQKKDQLRDDTLEGYADALRWGDFQSAWNYVDPAVRAAHPLTAQQKALYDTVRVAEYDTSGLAASGPDSVRQTAQISLIVKSSQRVYSVLDHQTWRWDAAAKRWWLESGLPDISPQQ
ncbi:MAG: hypothetical protein J0H27_16420 [Xanthomonadales bacterium]|nr:hypothetical protein [Xanthomonadales bacterium]ODU91866.1 MAG: hypothetical protein ABT18_14510 [Rhodanobacter sp. SCN 66-43]OJY84832.1 MAG: hypothetical protein BGP23_02190 [Xanthomonadales bacterium 66-474]